jgi:DNA-binding LytR/AlgR family response regulator
MSNLMELLPNDQFLQIHRSFFVSKKNIEFITTSKMSVNGELLPISKGFEKNIKELVSQIKTK